MADGTSPEAVNVVPPTVESAMRRTFQVLCREARVSDVVARSNYGHATEAMQRRYSTVSGSEQADGLARVIRLLELVPQQLPVPSGEGGGAGAFKAPTIDEGTGSKPSSLDRSKPA
jgi:hypothetical protein